MSYDPTLLAHTPTPWGGRRGAPLAPDQQRPGRRAVTEDGRHGLIVHEPGYSIYFGKVPLDEGSTAILLDSGAKQSFPTPSLFEETALPDLAQIEPDLPSLRASVYSVNTGPVLLVKPGRGRPAGRTVELRMTPEQLYRALLQAQKDLSQPFVLDTTRARVEAGIREAVPPLLDWVASHPTHPARRGMDDQALAALAARLHQPPAPQTQRAEPAPGDARRSCARSDQDILAALATAIPARPRR